MPRLVDTKNRKEIKIILPSSTQDDEAFVIVKSNISMEDMFDTTQKAFDTPKEQTIYALSMIIIDWNYVDADGNKEVVNTDNIRRLPPLDFLKIVDETNIDKMLSGYTVVEKKSLSSTLPTSKTTKKRKS